MRLLIAHTSFVTVDGQRIPINFENNIAFAPKYRRKVAYGKIKQDIANILSMLCKRKGVKIVEAEICPDHVHMLVEIPPSISVSYFVGYKDKPERA